MIYLDNAATTINKPEAVAKAVYDAIHTMGNAGRGVHDASLSSLRVITETRELLAEMFHFPDPNRVCFASNATESLNTAIRGMFCQKNQKEQESGSQEGGVQRIHVITTAMEHNSVLRPLYRMEREERMELTILPADEQGCISYEEMEAAIRPNTKAIVCAHASNLTGNVVNLVRVGDICKRHDLYLVVDAAQTAGVLPIDMEKMNIAVLCFTGHKGLMGPQGTGGICVRDDVKIAPLKSGGSGILSYEKKHPTVFPEALEAGTLNTHGIAGLHAALLYLKEIGIDEISRKEHELTRRFYEGVKDIPGVKVYGDFSGVGEKEVNEQINGSENVATSDTYQHAGIVTLNMGDYDSSDVSDELMQRFEIATRPGAHCAPLAHQTLGTVDQGAVRFSFSHRNTVEEVDAAIDAVRTLATE